MPLMEWQEIYGVGNPVLDGQHQKLFDIANRFHAAHAAGEGHAAVGALLDELVEYTVYHFTEEERIMLESGYAELESHKAHHAQLIALIQGYVRQFHGGASDLAPRLLQFVQAWLVSHILGVDRKYRPCIERSASR